MSSGQAPEIPVSVGVVKPMPQSVAPEESPKTCIPSIINQDQLLLLAQQSGNEEALAKLTEAISSLNATLLTAVQGNLTQPAPSEVATAPAQPPPLETIPKEDSEGSQKVDFKKALENVFAEKQMGQAKPQQLQPELVLEASQAPPPPPPPPPQMDAMEPTPLAIPKKTSVEADPAQPQNAVLMNELKNVVLGGKSLKKTNIPEKKNEVEKTNLNEVTIKWQLRKTVSKSDSPNESNSDKATPKESESISFPLKRSPKKEENGCSPSTKSPPSPEEVLRSQLEDARRRMRKVKKDETTSSETLNPNPAEEAINPAFLIKKRPPPNTKPRRKMEETQEVTLQLHATTTESGSAPMEDHIKNFFSRKAAKAEAKDKKPSISEAVEVAGISIPKKAISPAVVTKAKPVVPIKKASIPEKAEEETIAAVNAKKVVEDSDLNAQLKVPLEPVTRKPESDAEPANDVLSEPVTTPPKEIKAEASSVAVSAPPLPPPPPPMPTESKAKFEFSSSTICTSTSFKEVKSSSGFTKTTISKASMKEKTFGTGDGGDCRSALLSAITNFNKGILKNVKERGNRGRSCGDDLMAQMNEVLQQRFAACNGDDDSDSDECVGSDEEWEE